MDQGDGGGARRGTSLHLGSVYAPNWSQPRKANAHAPRLNGPHPEGLLPIALVTRVSLACLVATALLACVPAVAAAQVTPVCDAERTAPDEKCDTPKEKGMASDEELTAAQDPGGQQYTDPLDGDDDTSNTPTTSTPTATTSTPGATTATTADGAPVEAAAAGEGGSKPGIPQTGFPVLLLWFGGSLCIGAGLALRVAARTDS